MDAQYRGTGRRKKAIARVRLVPGTGKIVINKRNLEDYIKYETLRVLVKEPLMITDTMGQYDVLAYKAADIQVKQELLDTVFQELCYR